MRQAKQIEATEQAPKERILMLSTTHLLILHRDNWHLETCPLEDAEAISPVQFWLDGQLDHVRVFTFCQDRRKLQRVLHTHAKAELEGIQCRIGSTWEQLDADFELGACIGRLRDKMDYA